MIRARVDSALNHRFLIVLARASTKARTIAETFNGCGADYVLVICMILHTPCLVPLMLAVDIAKVAMAPIRASATTIHGYPPPCLVRGQVPCSVRRLGTDRRYSARVHQPNCAL